MVTDRVVVGSGRGYVVVRVGSYVVVRVAGTIVVAVIREVFIGVGTAIALEKKVCDGVRNSRITK